MSQYVEFSLDSLDNNQLDNFLKIVRHGAGYVKFICGEVLTEEVIIDSAKLVKPLFSLTDLPIPNDNDIIKHIIAEIDKVPTPVMARVDVHPGLQTVIKGESTEKHEGLQQVVHGEHINENIVVGEIKEGN